MGKQHVDPAHPVPRGSWSGFEGPGETERVSVTVPTPTHSPRAAWDSAKSGYTTRRRGDDSSSTTETTT